MIHIVVASHGKLAEGMADSAQMLAGVHDNLKYITFEENMGLDELEEEFEKTIVNTSPNNQYLILCDIKGGTPFNIAAEFSYENDNAAIIYGVNLPILVAALLETEDGEKNLAELVSYLKSQFEEAIGVSEI